LHERYLVAQAVNAGIVRTADTYQQISAGDGR
jgi:hypothetical protein